METSLKQRLIGAALLIALAVIFIPMLFDGAEREEQPVTLDMDVPPKPEFTFKEPPAPARASDVQKPTAPTEPKRIAPTKVADLGQRRPSNNPRGVKRDQSPADRAGKPFAPAQSAASKSARDAESPSAPDDSKAQLALSEPPTEKSSTNRQASGLRQSPRPSPTIAAAANQPSSAAKKDSPVAPPGGWAVQVGSFSERENAASLRKELQRAGFSAFEEKVVSGGEPVFRVKVGPEASRSRAKALQAMLRDQEDLDGIVVSHP